MGNVNVERLGRALFVLSMQRTHLKGRCSFENTKLLIVATSTFFFAYFCSSLGGVVGGANEELKLLLERKYW